MSGGDFVRRDADSFWRFAEQISKEVRSWPRWKLKVAAGAFCAPPLQQLLPTRNEGDVESERRAEDHPAS